MLKIVSVNQIGDNTCVKIYDPTKQQLIAVFDSYKKAAAKLGVSASVIQHACAKRGRVFSEILKKEIAPRLSAIKEGDQEKIDYCNRKILLDEKT